MVPTRKELIVTTSPVMRARRGIPATNLMWAELTRILGVDDLSALLGVGQNTLRRSGGTVQPSTGSALVPSSVGIGIRTA